MTSRKKTIDFEKSLDQLETLVNKLETGSLGLEEALKAFEQGIKITRDCQAALKEAEQKVELLTQNSQGEITTHPLDPEDV